MDELDIKALWKKGEASLSDSQGFDLNKSISSKSKGILQKIKFILTIEFWLNLIINPAGAIILYIKFSPIWGIFTGLVFFIYFIYYLFLIRSITRFNYAEDVKQSLTKIYSYMRFYVLHYKVMIWISFLVVPYLSAGYGFYVGYTGAEEPSWAEHAPEFEFTKQQAYFALGLIIIIPLLVSLLLQFVVGLLYETKIKKLKAMLKSL